MRNTFLNYNNEKNADFQNVRNGPQSPTAALDAYLDVPPFGALEKAIS
jgi:hypothetical protein